ncbi:ABC transporter ATP-binding protein [Corynebacterium glyciniphilum]|uniref:ATP-binding cassette domain-containing protein n=1 Tax=Corynebacterium glyciniphilum TaxID=1404244 RepID=UPI0026531708|nr:ABC transporter ATP-binding protein [Corynebacterium glyciniphilum]MDN5684045.1 ABC transporter ATP-binding protein [Corynebacterium glyciniphilum]
MTITLTDAEMSYPRATAGGAGRRRTPPVVGPLTLELDDGVVGLVGRNGAGKTTLLGLLAGQLKPSVGRVTSGGRDAFDDAVVLENTSFTGVDIDYAPSWTVQGILDLFARRYPRWNADEAARLRDVFGLVETSTYGVLSRGQRTAVGIIVGLASHTPVTLFDEPYVGLDAQTRRLFYRELMDSVEADPRLVVISTHHLPDLERIVDRVLVLERGQLIHDIDAEDLSGRFYRITGSQARVDALVSDAPGLTVLERRDMAGASRAVVDLGSDRTGGDVLPRQLSDLAAEPVDLEEAVIQLTGGETP